MKTANEVLRMYFPPPTCEGERNDDDNIVDAMEAYADQFKFKKNIDLFGEDIPNIFFKAVTSKNDDGWMQCDCGNSGIDNNDHYVVTTHHLKADEVPDLCLDSKTFAELVAKLLNEYYNR